MSDDLSFSSRSYTYKEQAARSITWGHHFLLLNILLAIFVGTAYVYAAPSMSGFLPFAYLILTLFGHMSFLACVIYLVLFFPLSFIGNFRAYRVISVLAAVFFFTLLLIDVKLYLYVKVHLSFGVLRLIFTQLDFNTGLNYNFLFIAVPIVLVFELCFAKIATAYLYSYKGRKLIYIRALIALLTACFISSHCIHIWADAVGYDKVTVLRSVYPAHYPMTAKSFLQSHGWISDEEHHSDPNVRINYPLSPLDLVENPEPKNVLTIFVNGLTQQDINAADTPNLYALKGRGISFENYYLPYRDIKDNLFAASYGLPRLYRPSLAQNRTMPVVLTEMFRQDYLVRALESRSDLLPLRVDSDDNGLEDVRVEEFGDNREVFAKAQELISGQGAEERSALTLMLNDLLAPKSRAEYALALSRTDAELGALMERLKASGLAHNTVVVISSLAGSSAGQESASLRFDRAYSHVPLILFVPYQGARAVSDLSSPYDLAPTIGAQALGISTSSSAYSIGYDLTSLPDRDFIVSDGGDIILIEKQHATIYRSNGQALVERSSGASEVRPNLADLISAMRELNRFVE